jgi:hypothetical protein
MISTLNSTAGLSGALNGVAKVRRWIQIHKAAFPGRLRFIVTRAPVFDCAGRGAM